MVIVHFLYGLEVNDAFRLGLVFVCSGEHKQNCDQSSFSASHLFITAAVNAAHQLKPETEVCTCVVRQGPAILVKDKPALFPRLDLPSHFDEESSTGFVSDGQVKAGVWVVSSCLDVAVEVKVVFSYRKVAT